MSRRERELSEQCIHMAGAVLTVGGPIMLMPTPKGLVAFEWHSYCGPMAVSRRHPHDERKLPGNHPFWDLVSAWKRQGMRLGPKRTCIVDLEPPCAACNDTGKGEHLGGRNWRLCPACNGRNAFRRARA